MLVRAQRRYVHVDHLRLTAESDSSVTDTVNPIPVNPIPVNPIPVNPIPVNPIPVKPIPVKPIPVNPIPVNPIPVNPIPVNPIPAMPIPAMPIPMPDVCVRRSEPDEPIHAPIAEAKPKAAILIGSPPIVTVRRSQRCIKPFWICNCPIIVFQ